MANKKVFSIEINGLTESVRSVSALEEKLNALQAQLNKMKKQGIEIPVEIGGTELVKEMKSISSKIKKATKGSLPIAEEKEYLNALRAREKALEAVNKELGDTGKNLAEYKQETKDLVAQETKARNETKQYANTLAGLKAELKDVTAARNNAIRGSEEYIRLTQRQLALTKELKQAEGEAGSFGRNVGNYTESIKEALNATENLKDEFKELRGGLIDSSKIFVKTQEEVEAIWQSFRGRNFNADDLLNAGLNIDNVEDELRRLDEFLRKIPGSQKAIREQTQEQYKDLKRVSNEFKRKLDMQVKADNQLRTQITKRINIGFGNEDMTWSNVTEAIGDIEDKLYQLAVAGKRNSQEFKTLAALASELKTQLRQVDYEIDSMTESSKGIQKMVSYAQGFTAIAQGAVGIGQLFGMEDENSLKGIQTLQSLQSIAMSLQTIQELRKQGTAFGKMLDDWVKKFEFLTIASNSWFKTNASGLETLNKELESTRLSFDMVMDGMLQSRDSVGYALIDPTSVEDLRAYASAMGFTAKQFDILKVAAKQAFIEFEIANKGYTETADVWEKFKSSLAMMKIGLKDLLGLYPKVAIQAENMGDALEDTGDITHLIDFPEMAKGAKLLTTVLKGVSVAIKGIAVALAATGIMLFIQLLGWAIDLLKKGATKLKELALGNDKLVDSITTLDGRLATLNARLERYISLLERANREGRLSDLGKATAQYVEYSNAVNEAAKQLKEFIKLRDDAKKLEDNLSAKGLTQSWNIANIEEFRKEYEQLLKAVEAGKDMWSTSDRNVGWLTKWFFTESDAKSDLGVMQKRVIEDIQNRINNLDLSKGTKELEEFFKVLDEEMYATSLENIENLFPEEEWAQVLKKRLESLREFFNQAKEASAQLDEVVKARLKTIRNNDTEAIKQSQERELKALKNAMDDEIEAAKGDQEIIASIKAKYQRLEQEMLDRHNKEILAKHRDLQRQIRDNYLSADDASLIKRLQEINNARYDAIEDAKLAQQEAEKQGLQMTEQYNELILSINKKYDAEIEREKREYHKTLLEEYDKYAQEIIKIEQGIASDRLDKAKQDVDIEYNVKSKSYGGNIDYKAEISQRIEQEKEYNKYRLEVEIQYLKDKKAIDDQYATFDRDDSLLQEEDRYKKALQSLEEFKYQGNATEEEYNKLKEKEVELHNKNLQRIQEHYQSTMEVNEKNHQGEIKDVIGQYLQEDVDLYQKYMDKVNDILSDVGREVNIFKIMKFGDANGKLKEALGVIKKGLKDVEKERKNIDDKLAKKEITFVDAKAAKEQLEETEKELKRGAKDIALMQKDLFGEVASQWKGMIDQWVNTIGSLLQTMNDTQMQLIENQLAEIDHQLEIQEQAYEKAEELAQEHKDKMDGIEDELAEARGARRQFLIDTYAAQQAAYLEDLAAQQKAAEEKERLEKKQQALEKKRKEQEKKSNVQQAIINTYMAVSNALAVQPWFVGLALSAVALGLGLANVSAIKNTPIYEDGGVISGPRHSQGGVKVLGGAAEVEGGEYITNRKTTAANLPLLNYINDQKRTLTAEDLMKFFASGTPKVKSKSTRMFADGGQLPSVGAEVNRVVQVNDASNENAVYVVQVTDIINATENLRKVQTLSGLYNEN